MITERTSLEESWIEAHPTLRLHERMDVRVYDAFADAWQTTTLFPGLVNTRWMRGRLGDAEMLRALRLAVLTAEPVA